MLITIKIGTSNLNYKWSRRIIVAFPDVKDENMNLIFCVDDGTPPIGLYCRLWAGLPGGMFLENWTDKAQSGRYGSHHTQQVPMILVLRAKRKSR